MKGSALDELADPPPGFGENILKDDLAVRLFIGPTYVYRGPYPRTEPLPSAWGAEKRSVNKCGAGTARFGRTRALVGVAEDEPPSRKATDRPGDDEIVERDRMSPEERVERGKSRRGDGENRVHPVSPVFGQRGLCG